MPHSVIAPVSGTLSSLEHAPDPIFSMGVVGWGVAIEPAREVGQVIAPVDGTIERLEPHVFSIAFPGGAVMVQVGIGADKVAGEGYALLKQRGDKVDAGDPIVEWDPAKLEALGVTPMVLVIAIEQDEFALSGVKTSGRITMGSVAFVIK
jgi:PTS system N-acetylglucosamine-specific IIA component